MASEKITAIIDSVKELSVLELKELIDAYCEEFGVSAVAAAAPAAAGAAAPDGAACPRQSAGWPDAALFRRMPWSFPPYHFMYFSIRESSFFSSRREGLRLSLWRTSSSVCQPFSCQRRRIPLRYRQFSSFL